MKEKEIKILPEDLKRLEGIYPDMSEAQLEQIALGEAVGVDFSSYAMKELSPEKMAECREELLLRRRRAITAFECRYFYGTMKYLDMFMPVRDTLFDALVEEKYGLSYTDIDRWASSNGQLQGKMTKLFDALTKGMTTVDIFEDKSALLDKKYADIIKGIKVEENAVATLVRFPLNMTADVYKTFGKGAFDENLGVGISENTAFVIKNKLASYSEAYFSIALRSPDFSIALATVPNRSAVKSEADLAVAIIDKDTLYYDNASKYIDTSLFTKGLRS